MHAFQLQLCLRFACAAQAQLLQPHQVFPQLRCRALGRRARIVQLVHQPRGERPQRHQLFAMQRLHLVGLHPQRHIRQNYLARLRAAGKQLPELLLRKSQ